MSLIDCRIGTPVSIGTALKAGLMALAAEGNSTATNILESQGETWTGELPGIGEHADRVSTTRNLLAFETGRPHRRSRKSK
ncbi:MAG TPA: hypothetical protein VFT82_02880 [Candidatus Paceibacterota bacterium]|nr:hypothetical protein [Candidatus Paceibacterota bacterium]